MILGAVLAPLVAWAAPVTICERADTGISVSTIMPGADRDMVLRESGLDPVRCWDADSASLPARYRVDPRDPSQRIQQRHRWRRGPANTVVIDPAVMGPRGPDILRQFAREFPAARRAAIAVTPYGRSLLDAIRERDWPLAREAMRLIAGKVGTPEEVLTAKEVILLREIARDYEADLG